MRDRWLWGALAALAVAGCAGEGVESGRPIRRGDVVRPRPHLPEPWTAGRSTAFAVYVEVSRPGRPDPYDLMDDLVPEGSVRVTGTVSFFAGDTRLDDPRSLAFVHEC